LAELPHPHARLYQMVTGQVWTQDNQRSIRLRETEINTTGMCLVKKHQASVHSTDERRGVQ